MLFPEPEFRDEVRSELRAIRLMLITIIDNQEKQKMTEQQNVDALTADLTQIDADEKANAAAIAAAQQGLDTIITGLQAGQAPDLTELLAVKAVLDGDHPTLEAAVTALSADPNLAASSGTTTPAS